MVTSGSNCITSRQFDVGSLKKGGGIASGIQVRSEGIIIGCRSGDDDRRVQKGLLRNSVQTSVQNKGTARFSLTASYFYLKEDWFCYFWGLNYGEWIKEFYKKKICIYNFFI